MPATKSILAARWRESMFSGELPHQLPSQLQGSPLFPSSAQAHSPQLKGKKTGSGFGFRSQNSWGDFIHSRPSEDRNETK